MFMYLKKKEDSDRDSVSANSQILMTRTRTRGRNNVIGTSLLLIGTLHTLLEHSTPYWNTPHLIGTPQQTP